MRIFLRTKDKLSERSTGLKRCELHFSKSDLSLSPADDFLKKITLCFPFYCYTYYINTQRTLHFARWAIPLATSVAILVFICLVNPLLTFSKLWSVCRDFFKNSIKLPFSAISKTTSKWPAENQRCWTESLGKMLNGKPRPLLVKGNWHSLKQLICNNSVYKKGSCMVISLPT